MAYISPALARALVPVIFSLFVIASPCLETASANPNAGGSGEGGGEAEADAEFNTLAALAVLKMSDAAIRRLSYKPNMPFRFPDGFKRYMMRRLFKSVLIDREFITRVMRRMEILGNNRDRFDYLDNRVKFVERRYRGIERQIEELKKNIADDPPILSEWGTRHLLTSEYPSEAIFERYAEEHKDPRIRKLAQLYLDRSRVYEVRELLKDWRVFPDAGPRPGPGGR